METRSIIDSRFISCLICIALFYSCASPEDKASEPSTASERSAPVPPLDAATKLEERGSHLRTVEIRKMKFIPEEITVQKGDTVIWINHDMVTHCITEEKAKAWTSSNIEAGASWKKAVTSSSDYYCAIHQVMKGKISVQ